MRILFEVHHPAHIHFFKFIIQGLQNQEHSCRVVGRDRDVMKRLLESYPWINSEQSTAASAGKRNRFPIVELPKRHWLVAKQIRRFKPDLVLSLMGSYSQSARLLGVPSWIFTDSEFQSFNHRIAHPFASRIYTPNCFYKELGPKQIRYNSYHELTFLHQNHFKPDPGILSELGGVQENGYILLRLSAWDTLHDVKHQGLADATPKLVEDLAQRFPLFIVPEGGKLPPEWEQYRFPAPPEKLHDALAFARLVVTEGASTASEATCLGTPVVYVNSTDERGYLVDQQGRYGLPLCFSSAEGVSQAVETLLQTPFDSQDREKQRSQICEDHQDLAQYVVEQVNEFSNQLHQSDEQRSA
ncbi:DUF354 domain-containing protein [Pelagicoccus albus]|uniref:DUF354 domain-containing protein n=1 Tax=Pelagicoccus albus TaxID=415222 RepID=A0A7X1B574_9BACT|nr:DUF354 domain-containing protein [Pelagicoccus albus]MBC2605830.1 DUF354 domain-containing protein [Pelagicoccus albus]